MDRLETTGAAWLGLTLACAAARTTSTTTSRKTNTIDSSPFTTTATKPASLCPVPRPPWPNTKRQGDPREEGIHSEKNLESCSHPPEAQKMGKETRAACRQSESHCSSPLKLSPLRKQDDHRLVAREDGSLFVEKLVSDKATFLLDFSTDTRGNH